MFELPHTGWINILNSFQKVNETSKHLKLWFEVDSGVLPILLDSLFRLVHWNTNIPGFPVGSKISGL